MKLPYEVDDDPHYAMVIEAIKHELDQMNLPDEFNSSLAQIDRVLIALEQLYGD